MVGDCDESIAMERLDACLHGRPTPLEVVGVLSEVHRMKDV